jgi:hypothetical protein
MPIFKTLMEPDRPVTFDDVKPAEPPAPKPARRQLRRRLLARSCVRLESIVEAEARDVGLQIETVGKRIFWIRASMEREPSVLAGY